MSETSGHAQGWLARLSATERALFVVHFQAAIEIYRTLNEEGTVSQMEAAFGDARDPLDALSSFRAFAASLRRQEARFRELASHIEEITELIARNFEQ